MAISNILEGLRSPPSPNGPYAYGRGTHNVIEEKKLKERTE